MKMTGNTFGIARCTVGAAVHEICQIVSENIGPKIVKFPVYMHKVAEAAGHFYKSLDFPRLSGVLMVPTYKPNTQAKITTTIFLMRCAIQWTVKLYVMHMGNL